MAARNRTFSVSSILLFSTLVLCLWTASKATAADVTLEWSDNSDNEEGFVVERQVIFGIFLPAGNVGANVTTFVDRGLLSLMTYSYRVCAYNRYGHSAFSGVASTVTPPDAPPPPPVVVNTAPALNSLQDISINSKNQASVSITVGDNEESTDTLTLTARSSDQLLLSDSAITIVGTGANRTLVATPAARRTGTTTVTVTVSDGKLTTTQTFLLTVVPVNQAPVLSSVANLSPGYGSSAMAYFEIDDAETPADDLVVSADSSNPTLIPTNQILLGGIGATRYAIISPTFRRIGDSTITLRVSDGVHETDTSFVVSVRK